MKNFRVSHRLIWLTSVRLWHKYSQFFLVSVVLPSRENYHCARFPSYCIIGNSFGKRCIGIVRAIVRASVTKLIRMGHNGLATISIWRRERLVDFTIVDIDGILRNAPSPASAGWPQQRSLRLQFSDCSWTRACNVNQVFVIRASIVGLLNYCSYTRRKSLIAGKRPAPPRKDIAFTAAWSCIELYWPGELNCQTRAKQQKCARVIRGGKCPRRNEKNFCESLSMNEKKREICIMKLGF